MEASGVPPIRILAVTVPPPKKGSGPEAEAASHSLLPEMPTPAGVSVHTSPPSQLTSGACPAPYRNYPGPPGDSPWLLTLTPTLQAAPFE